ncbi:DNA polymerase III subunit gamma/tau [Weissella soli]|uniref:DNA-directed DNA polymerase n=1 Tax=Weissella soli TaxID=155866 RepID=A0A288Q9M7_9LACO|nr:DNA polymerase III subunit gamma/tau [Weissella soli]AOT56994.1 DNA-directed DNA polymerase [Weissella soli]NKY83445.1 DNA polymerase III subunit gamma/tau [Weissella soli]RDL05263.1 DNA polymerase-3 subunit gamma/tau [Weissella soli]GEN93696.1 DNA polymerase III subunit gamma/tau [Weissella soli]
MAYQALYRTWRPQKFSDMIGQGVVTKTLRNAIMTGQTSHAYLFTGPRGTGKTSAAKIFAKAVNCLNPIDGEPDGVCALCQAADDGTLGDVIELDAASNNGVDEIRQIREDVNYAPTQAKFKVYIIDEVHMLSTGAFNALLKTLEEPPANVIFILATTEPQKIPATIISRTQRFDFKRIDAQAAYERMVYILGERSNTFDDAAIRVIANAADGGMRDALSILDQALSFGSGHVSLENALLVTGSVTQTILGEYVAAVVAEDTQAALVKLSEVLSEGKDAGRFVEDLISYARDLLLSSEAPELISLVPDETFKQLAAEQPATTWYRMIDTLNETQQQLRFTSRPSIYLEVLTVKLSQPQVQTTVQAVVTPQPQVNQPVPATTTPVSTDAPTVTPEPAPVASEAVTANKAIRKAPKPLENKTAVFEVLNEATKGDLERVNTVWADVVNQLSGVEKGQMNTAKPIAASPTGLVIGFDFDIFRVQVMNNATLINLLTEQIRTYSNASAERQLVLINNENWPTIRAEYVKQRQQMATQPATPTSQTGAIDNEPLESPVVVEQDASTQKALALFGDIVKVVKD